MELIFTPRAVRDLKSLEKRLAERIIGELEKVAADPFRHHGKAQAMKGDPPTFRLRIGDHRAVYSVDRDAGTVIVTRIGDRKEVYR